MIAKTRWRQTKFGAGVNKAFMFMRNSKEVLEMNTQIKSNQNKCDEILHSKLTKTDEQSTWITNERDINTYLQTAETVSSRRTATHQE